VTSVSKLFGYYVADLPNYDIPDNSVPKDERRRWLMDLCVKYTQTYFLESRDIQPLAQQVQELHDSLKLGFICRLDGCDKSYIHHSARVK